MPKARAISCNDCDAFQRPHISVLCIAESFIRLYSVIHTTLREKTYTRWCCIDRLSRHEFEEAEASESSEEGASEEETQTESDEELTERIENLQKQLDELPPRAKGKAALKRGLAEAQRKLASRSLKGRVEYLICDEKLLVRYRETWLADKAAEELDYPIFFAVSEKGGKDNSGDPIYKKDTNGELVLDNHGHLIVHHDLDEIAEAFVAFAKDQGFDFWMEV